LPVDFSFILFSFCSFRIRASYIAITRFDHAIDMTVSRQTYFTSSRTAKSSV
jgi:hypothetical protein